MCNSFWCRVTCQAGCSGGFSNPLEVGLTGNIINTKLEQNVSMLLGQWRNELIVSVGWQGFVDVCHAPTLNT